MTASRRNFADVACGGEELAFTATLRSRSEAEASKGDGGIAILRGSPKMARTSG